jgi:hypothetical protein
MTDCHPEGWRAGSGKSEPKHKKEPVPKRVKAGMLRSRAKMKNAPSHPPPPKGQMIKALVMTKALFNIT